MVRRRRHDAGAEREAGQVDGEEAGAVGDLGEAEGAPRRAIEATG